jgi:hypothetical protein
MNLPYRARPGMGFVLLVAAIIMSATFFGWGWRTPPLDRVWQMQLELMLGTRAALAGEERQLLQETLVAYPMLAENMLDGAPGGLVSAHVGGVVDMGYAYVLRRTPQAPGVLVVESPSGEKLMLEVSTSIVTIEGAASGDEPFVWTLPDAGPFPQLVDVRLVPAKELDPLTGTRDSSGLRPLRVELRAGP